MVGISMFLAIAICIFGAALLFAALSRPFSDLIPVTAPGVNATQQQTPAAGDLQTQSTAPTPAPVIAAQPTAAASQETPPVATETAAFEADYQISAGQSVNFRAGPSTSDAIIMAVPPETPLQFLDEEEPTANPSDGSRWMKFRTESGEEGWIREIDTEPYQP